MPEMLNHIRTGRSLSELVLVPNMMKVRDEGLDRNPLRHLMLGLCRHMSGLQQLAQPLIHRLPSFARLVNPALGRLGKPARFIALDVPLLRLKLGS